MADIRELLGAQTFEAVEKKLRAEIVIGIEALKPQCKHPQTEATADGSCCKNPEIWFYLDEAIAVAKGGKR